VNFCIGLGAAGFWSLDRIGRYNRPIGLKNRVFRLGYCALSDTTDCFILPVDADLDARGLLCPLPLLKAKQALRNLKPGQVLRVLATDAGSVRDFHAYASISGIELCDHAVRDAVYCYLLRIPNT